MHDDEWCMYGGGGGGGSMCSSEYWREKDGVVKVGKDGARQRAGAEEGIEPKAGLKGKSMR